MFQKYKMYLQLERGLSANSRQAYLHDVARFLDWLEGEGTAPEAVSLPLLERYSWTLLDLGIQPRSIARNLSALRSFYGFLALDGYIRQDPTELLDSPRPPSTCPPCSRVTRWSACSKPPTSACRRSGATTAYWRCSTPPASASANSARCA